MKKKLIFIILANIFIFIFLELSAKIILKTLNKDSFYRIGNIPDNLYDYLTGYYNKPNTKEIINPYRQATDRYGFNLDGDREETDLTLKKNKIFRLFILGGSTVQGRFLENKYDPISARLEKKLKNNLSDLDVIFEVVNLGASSFFSGQEFSLIEKKISYAMHPDYIIVVNGTNDYALPFDNEFHLSNSHYYQIEFQKRFLKNSSNLLYYFDDWSSKNISLYFLTKKIIEKITGIYLFDRELREKKLLSKGNSDLELVNKNKAYRYIYNLKRVSEVADKKTHISYFFQPQMLPRNINTLSEPDRDKYKSFEKINENYFTNKQLFYNLAKKEIHKFNNLDKTKNNKHFELVDLQNILDLSSNGENFYSDHVHYTPVSREIIAENIFNSIKNKIRAMKNLD